MRNSIIMKTVIKKNLAHLLLMLISVCSAYEVSIISDKNNLDLYLVIILLVSLSIITWALNVLIESNKRNSFEYKISGSWIQRHQRASSPNVTYCIMEIVICDNGEIHLKGNVYNYDGSFIADWEAMHAGVNINKKCVIYVYDGKYQDDILAGNGYGKVSFTYTNSEILTGEGYFQDSRSLHNPIHYTVDKIDNICELIECNLPQNNRQKEDFIKKYHNYMLNK